MPPGYVQGPGGKRLKAARRASDAVADLMEFVLRRLQNLSYLLPTVCGRLVVALASLSLLMWPTVAASASPFNTLDGAWSGSGQVRFEGDRNERLVCRAYYNSKDGGTGLGLAIRCASTSYKIEMRAALKYRGGQVSGTWEERTYNAAGTMKGQAGSGTMHIDFSGNVSGRMSLDFNRSRQKVSISALGGGAANIHLNLSRR